MKLKILALLTLSLSLACTQAKADEFFFLDRMKSKFKNSINFINTKFNRTIKFNRTMTPSPSDSSPFVEKQVAEKQVSNSNTSAFFYSPFNAFCSLLNSEPLTTEELENAQDNEQDSKTINFNQPFWLADMTYAQSECDFCNFVRSLFPWNN